MEKTRQVLNELRKININNNLPVDQIDKTLEEMQDAKVSTPVIGKFSSGKSAMINTLLGYPMKLLREDITPETAVPAEIIYAEGREFARIIQNDMSVRDISLEEYLNTEFDASSILRVRLFLNSGFLKEIPDVMIVDMPGFESGYAIHDKALSDYLPSSLAYIVTFPADDLNMSSSVKDILKNLNLNDMPVCIVVTKYDKRNNEFDETLEYLKKSLRKYISNNELSIYKTSSLDGDAEEVKGFLKNIQSQSLEILSQKYRKIVMPVLDDTESNLKFKLEKSELGESELEEEEEKLEKQLARMESKFCEEKVKFNAEAQEAISEIKNDVEVALEAQESGLVSMVLSHQSINSQISSTIRTAVMASVKNRFVPRVETYLRRVGNCLNDSDVGDVQFNFRFDVQEIKNNLTPSILAVVAGLALELPPIVNVIVAVGALLIGIMDTERKKQEQEQEIRSRIRTEVIPQAVREVGIRVETAIGKQVSIINEDIEKELANKRNSLEKAIEDLRKRMADEKDKKDKQTASYQADLEKVQELRRVIE